MLKKMSLAAKLVGGFIVVVSIMSIGAGTAIWGLFDMNHAAAEMEQRLSNMALANETAFWSVKQYQAQADTIINESLECKKGFDEAANTWSI